MDSAMIDAAIALVNLQKSHMIEVCGFKFYFTVCSRHKGLK